MSESGGFARSLSKLLCILSGCVAGFSADCEAAHRLLESVAEQPAAARWVRTGDLNIARSGHTATLLPDGKVLVSGGENNGSILDSAELYDPNTGTWRLTGHLNAGHTGHTATLLSNGQVLIVGGRISLNGFFNAELYDPRSGTWAPTPTQTSNRLGHTATLLANGNVTVVGGAVNNYELATNSALYDPANGAWLSSYGLAFPRVAHESTLLQDGRLLVTGGTSDVEFYSPAIATVEIRDQAEGTWSQTGSLIFVSIFHTATLLNSGMVVVAGSPSELFDPSIGLWKTTGSLSVDRGLHTASLLRDGKVLVAGGYVQNTNRQTESAEIYSPDSAIWDNTASLIIARAQHTATLLPDGSVLVVGGQGAGGALKSAELYRQSVPSMTIGPGFTGSWYDPAQSGHGIFVQVLPGQRLYTAWFTFDPTGVSQSWFTGVGTYSGSTASITAVEQPSGGRWIPNFDPNQIVRHPWGTLTFTFSDCNHGTVSFNSVAGYGSGTMSLTRLTQPGGLTCP